MTRMFSLANLGKSLIVLSVFTSLSVMSNDYDKEVEYEVSITNVTKKQIFTPILAATHGSSVALFKAGKPASPQLATLAESGNPQPLATLLRANAKVMQVKTNPDVLLPGKTVKIRIKGNRTASRLSVAAMLIPSNDAFFAVNAIKLPFKKKVVVARAYDAGSEVNDELCSNIPGPPSVCNGVGESPGTGGEGFVHVHSGIHGIADLKASEYDWKNPVAIIKIRRIK